jgi:hypothetical protein
MPTCPPAGASSLPSSPSHHWNEDTGGLMESESEMYMHSEPKEKVQTHTRVTHQLFLFHGPPLVLQDLLKTQNNGQLKVKSKDRRTKKTHGPLDSIDFFRVGGDSKFPHLELVLIFIFIKVKSQLQLGTQLQILFCNLLSPTFSFPFHAEANS